MKRYKLIKEYPESPVLRTEIFPLDYLAKVKQWKYDGSNNLLNIKPEDYPEFWEEIKEYPKIIEIRKYDKVFTDGFCSATLRPNGLYLNSKDQENDGFYELHNRLTIGYIIYKVQTSETDVWTIGDKVCWDWYKSDYPYFTISKFYYRDNEIVFDTIEDSAQAFKFFKSLKCYKAKEPLFVTEDGVEIFELDTEFFVVNTSNDEFRLIPNKCSSRNTNFKWAHLKIFSTKEAAEKYIDDNKPMFSKKQILDALEFSKVHGISGVIYLKDFKQKIGI